MKTIKKYIEESLLDDENDLVDSLLYHPKNKDELIKAIKVCLDAKIYDLNCIDTSKITDMSNLFDMYSSVNLWAKYRKHLNKIDISKWDVSNVTKMIGMFYNSNFNGDISKWDVSNVTNMRHMFEESKFNQDISKWDISKVKNMDFMFRDSKFNQDISKWDVSNVLYYHRVFNNCPIKEKYKPKFKLIPNHLNITL